jgi:hypothetical protein
MQAKASALVVVPVIRNNEKMSLRVSFAGAPGAVIEPLPLVLAACSLSVAGILVTRLPIQFGFEFLPITAVLLQIPADQDGKEGEQDRGEDDQSDRVAHNHCPAAPETMVIIEALPSRLWCDEFRSLFKGTESLESSPFLLLFPPFPLRPYCAGTRCDCRKYQS